MKRSGFLALCLSAVAAVFGVIAITPVAHAQMFEDFRGNFSPPSASATGERFYTTTEYLAWQTTGMKLPPLVTSNPVGTAPGEAGVIGVPSTQILFGNDTLFDDIQSGFRTRGGFKLTGRVSLEGDYFRLAEQDETFRVGPSTTQILGRPFIDVAPDAGPVRYETQLFNVPGDFDGSFEVAAASQFQGGGIGLRFDLLCCDPPACACPSPCGGSCCKPVCGPQHSLALYMGYRHLSLDESIGMREILNDGTDRFEVTDFFGTDSRFNGIEFGLDYACWTGNIGFSAFGRFAAGVNQNEVTINGATINTGVLQDTPGGILTQTSNIGVTEHDVAALSAQFGFNLHAQLFPRLSANVGYSGMFWGNVARAGEQIDLNLNRGLFPPQIAPPGTIGAQRTGETSDFFAHGLNVGLTYAM